jgi:hypothetical protein
VKRQQAIPTTANPIGDDCEAGCHWHVACAAEQIANW